MILFLVSCDPEKWNIYSLIKHFDSAKFPAQIGDSIDKLMERNFIVVKDLFDNGTPATYRTTKEGKEYLNREFSGDEILEYIKTFDKPEVLYLWIKKYIDEGNALQHGG